MTLPADDGARYLRQLMLAEVGAEGQARLGGAVVRLSGGSSASRAHAADYLQRAGLGVHTDGGPTQPASADAPPLELLRPLASPAALAPAMDLFLGALTAVEGIKQVLGVGQPAALPANLFLLGDD